MLSMIGAYIVDPTGVHEAEKEEPIHGEISRKAFENVLVALLFFYMLFAVNTEVNYSSEYVLSFEILPSTYTDGMAY